MNNKIKKLSVLLILAVFLGRTILFVPIFIWKKNIIHQTVDKISSTAHSKKHITNIFELSYSEYLSLNWVKEKKEFRLNQEMYDILKTEISTNKIKIYCYADKKEKQLYAKLKKYFNNSNGDNAKDIYTGINEIFKYHILFFKDISKMFQFPFLLEKGLLTQNILQKSLFLPDIPLPPPRILY